MDTNKPESIKYLESRLGQEVFVSKWNVITQDETDAFAKLTDDEDPMHNDPEWASKTPWGGTIVQAAHVLSLGVAPIVNSDIPLDIETDGNSYVLNYGYDRVRVLSPLRVGHRFRYRGKIKNIRSKSQNEFIITWDVTVEVEAQEKPFMVYESLMYWATGQELPSVSKHSKK